MSGYTIGEIIVWLVLAAALGFALGWLARTLVHGVITAAAREDVPPPDDVPVDEDVPASRSVPASAEPLADGAAPSPDYVVKGKKSSMIYHRPDSPAYARTRADVWFRSEDDAVAAGFRKPKNG